MIAVLYVGLVLIVLVAAAGMIPLKRYADREWRRHQRIEMYRAALKAGVLSINEVRLAMGQVGTAAHEAAIAFGRLREAMKSDGVSVNQIRTNLGHPQIHGSITGRIQR